MLYIWNFDCGDYKLHNKGFNINSKYNITYDYLSNTIKLVEMNSSFTTFGEIIYQNVLRLLEKMGQEKLLFEFIIRSLREFEKR